MGTDEHTLVLPNDLASLPKLGEFLTDAGTRFGWDEDVGYQLNLAVEEIVANAILHGQRELGAHEISVTMRVEQGWVIITVEDDGVPFNPLDVPPADINAALENRRIGGLGMHLVRAVIPSLSYSREGDRNRLVMKKPIPASA